jgi:hypothetical protein
MLPQTKNIPYFTNSSRFSSQFCAEDFPTFSFMAFSGVTVDEAKGI